MNDIRSTTTNMKTKETDDQSVKIMLDSFEKQARRSEIQSEKQLELNLTRDSLAQLHNSLLFLKTEKYEAQKWVLNT